MADKEKKDPKKIKDEAEMKDLLDQARREVLMARATRPKMEKHRKGNPGGYGIFSSRGFQISFILIVVLSFALSLAVGMCAFSEEKQEVERKPVAPVADEIYRTQINKGEEQVTVIADNTTVIYTKSNHNFYVLYDDANGNRKRKTILAGNNALDYTCRVYEPWPWNVEIEGAHDSTKIQFNVVRGVSRRK